MNKAAFLIAMDELLELDLGTLSGSEQLSSIGSWDSLAVLGFIALVDQKFGIVLSPASIGDANTINDLMVLLGDKISKD